VLIINKTHNTGCDVELIRDKVLKIQHKFLNTLELNICNNNLEKLIIYWAAKETLYKIYGLKSLDFKENLSVEDFADNKIIGKITNSSVEKQYLLHWEKLGTYILVYCLNEI
jgi:4'-phosphopantetheinyl transferase